MEHKQMLLLLSDSLREIILNVKEKHDCLIAKDLIEADDVINAYNSTLRRFSWSHDQSLKIILDVLLEKRDSLINDSVRLLGFRVNAFEISFLPEGREPVYNCDGNWSRENRQTGKPARIIQKLLVNKHSCKEFEDFNNWIKAEMVNSGEFKLVEGSDITKYYLDENYYKCEGTLGNSCMRHEECQDYFKVYEDSAKMLVCLKNGLVLGRAIVWELPEGTFMDRIYTCMDYLQNQFIEYAELHKWFHRDNNSLLSDGDYQYWMSPDNNYESSVSISLTIQLTKRYDFFPYMDSFRYFNSEANTISTNPNFGNIYLSSTNGTWEPTEGFVCAHCGAVVTAYEGDDPDGMVYSDYEDGWYCEDHAYWCNGIQDYVACTTDVEEAHVTPNLTETYPLEYLEEHSGDFALIDGEYYCINNFPTITKDEEGNFILKDE